MPAETNLTLSSHLGEIRSIDFVNRFGTSISDLLRLLGITNRLQLAQNQKIQMYKWKVTKPTGQVGEGETIKLTKVERVKDRDYTLSLNKYRKATTAEAVSMWGLDMAQNKTDEKVLREVQRDVKDSFFTFLATAPTKLAVTTLQQALSKAPAKAGSFFDENPAMVSLVHPMTVAEWVGDGQITSGPSTDFGFTLLKNFSSTNHNVLEFYGVPEGKVYTTAMENLVFAYLSVSGDLSQGFNLVVDETGTIGVGHGSPRTDNATLETLVLHGSTIFPEVVDAVIETTITPASQGGGG